MSNFTVVMPCWIINDEIWELTRNAIGSLGDVNLIIVDNGSPLGGGYLRLVADTYIRNKENLGFAKAVNQGLMLGQLGNYTVVANNDIRVSPNWQEVAKEVFTKNKYDNIYSCHFRMIPYDESFSYGDQTWYKNKERWCTGSLLIFNKDQQLFLFDEQFLNSYDDWDYLKRVRDAGLLTAYTNKACFQHKDSSTQIFVPERMDNEARNKELFKVKHGGYAEDLFSKQYPEQMEENWRPFP